MSLSPGLYLVRGLELPCARLGTFRAGAYTPPTTTSGSAAPGRQTALENWDAGVAAPRMLNLGAFAEIPSEEPGNDRLTGITVTDIGLRQLKNSVKPLQTCGATPRPTCGSRTPRARATPRVLHHGRRREERAVAGARQRHGAVRPRRADVSDFDVGDHLNGQDWIASGNLITGSPQGIENGIGTGDVIDNVMIGTHVPGSPKIGVNVGSTGTGIWDNMIARNRIVDFPSRSACPTRSAP